MEDDKQPSIVRKYNLMDMSNFSKTLKEPGTAKPQLVIISACHSSKFAQILLDCGIPTVISIISNSVV